MKQYQNIHLSDRSLFQEYRTKFSTNISQAHNILDDTDLQTKVFRAVEVNDIQNNIIELENYFDANIPQKLQEFLNKLQTNINNLQNTGVFVPLKDYYSNNVTEYNYNLYYLGGNDTIWTGNAPSSPDWLYLGLRGEKGAFGTDLIVKSQWENNISYNAKDMVVYEGILYAAVQNSVGQIPKDNTEFWKIVVSCDRRYIHMDSTDLQNGDIYWQTL